MSVVRPDGKLHPRRSQTVATATARLTIRDATENDLAAIIAIFNATVPTRMVTAQLEPITIEERLSWFRQHSPNRYPLWVAESDDGAIAAWISLESFRPRDAYRATAEVSVYVHKHFR